MIGMNKNNYKLNMDIKYDYLEVIKVPEIIGDNKEKWFNQTLCRVNSSVLRLGIFEGEFHMHKHDNDDEVFFVLDGELLIESEKGNFKLKKNEGICIPKGIMHRTIANTKTIVLMIENEGIKPTGD